MASSKSNLSSIYHRYNGQVYFVPTNNWQFATSSIARSTRFVLPDAMFDQTSTSMDPGNFARLYSAHSHAPILWYTPGGILGDEVYNFLYKLPGIGNITVFHEQSAPNLHPLDKKNLEAMVKEYWDCRQEPPFFSTNKSEGLFIINVLESRTPTSIQSQAEIDLNQVTSWLNLHQNLDKIAPEQHKRLPSVMIIIPNTPHFACAISPLAAYIQGTLVYLNSTYSMENTIISSEIASTAIENSRIDEIWLVGPTCQLQSHLEMSINAKRKNQGYFDRTVKVRVIPGDNHFSVSEQVAVLLLTYRYLDAILVEALIHPEGREYFFNFLASDKMRTLYHHCNRVLDLADQLRRSDFQAIRNVHDVYWSMLDQERRNFIEQFQLLVPNLKREIDNMAVIADYSTDEAVPHNLIDAAAFAARRGVPLLLLRPLSSEISYSIGSLMDKTDDQLDKMNKLQTERIKLNPENISGKKSPEADLEWQKLKSHIEILKKETEALRHNLRDNLYKTGEVLYESLVPLAVRNTLYILCPKYLAVFIQDPSLPIELIRETDNLDTHQTYKNDITLHEDNLKLKEEHKYNYDRFWSLRYAIGHISGINLYETNLTSNSSFFTPRTSVDGNIQVLLCSNPTRDLFFSNLEADKIAKLFRNWEGSIDNKQVKLIVHRLASELQETEVPTRDHLIAALRRGFDIVHYSGHAFFDNVLPGRSGLLLSDNVLTAADIRFMLDLGRNPIIYASACSTGRIKSISSRFTGLASAFIRAGAAGYISSLWSLDDRDAATLASEYYNILLTEHSPIGECLRKAKLHARSNFLQTKSDFIMWASLVLYGDPTLSIFDSHSEDTIDGEY